MEQRITFPRCSDYHLHLGISSVSQKNSLNSKYTVLICFGGGLCFFSIIYTAIGRPIILCNDGGLLRKDIQSRYALNLVVSSAFVSILFIFCVK